MTEPLNDDQLRAWRAAYGRLQQEGSADCPEPERLAGLLGDELAAAEREALASHVTACRACSAAFGSLAELDGEARRLGLAVRGTPPAGGRLVLGGALAAAALLAGIVLLQPWGWRSGQPSPEPTLLRSLQAGARAPQAGARLAEAPTLLAWDAQAGAGGYLVRLLDGQARLVWETETQVAQVDLPAQVAASLAPGQYYWVVECQGPAAVRRLGPFWFTLQARPSPGVR